MARLDYSVRTCYSYDMSRGVKATLVISRVIVSRLKERALARKESLSATVSSLLRSALAADRGCRRCVMKPLPTFKVDRILVDVTDRAALGRAMGTASECSNRCGCRSVHRRGS